MNGVANLDITAIPCDLLDMDIREWDGVAKDGVSCGLRYSRQFHIAPNFAKLTELPGYAHGIEMSYASFISALLTC